MNLIIVCPKCENRSTMPLARVPAGNLKTTCHTCGHKFSLNKESFENCRLEQQTRNEPEDQAYQDDGWRVDLTMCQGMSYDVANVGNLVNTGMLTPETGVLPPGESNYIPAREIPQLKKYFEKYEQKNARKR